jgi:hypothetical protein
MIGGMAKTSQQVILPLNDKEDILALSVVRQEAQAEVVRRLISKALPQYKGLHTKQINSLYEALDALGVDHMEALEEMSKVRTRADGTRRTLTLKDVQGAKRFPWPASRTS